MTIKTYSFSVPCSYSYEIKAKSESQARKILHERGGIDIAGELCINERDYKEAELISIDGLDSRSLLEIMIEEKEDE